MENTKNILVEYPKNKNIKFLFSSYPAEELTGRDRIVKEQLRFPSEGVKDVFIVVETDLTDLPASLQKTLKDNIQLNDSDVIIFRAFFSEGNKSLIPESNMDIYNLVYVESDWDKKIKDKKLN